MGSWVGDTIRATTSAVLKRNKKLHSPHGIIMVSVMPPSGVGGLPGFNMPHHDMSLASRYNHLAVMQADQASYYHHTMAAQTQAAAVNQEQIAAQPKPQPPPQAQISRKMVEVTRGRPRGKTMPQAPIMTTSSDERSAVSKPKMCDLPGCKGIHDHQSNKNNCRSKVTKDQPSIGDGGPPRVRTSTQASSGSGSSASTAPPDISSLSKSLFVDCSVEYELPMVPKIPPDSQPLLVIHPGWQQKRRITRSSSQQRLIYEEQQRMALQQHQHQYLQYMSSLGVCSQCPPHANPQGNHPPASTSQQPQPPQQQQAATAHQLQPPRPIQPNMAAASSSTTSRKRSYQATNLPQMPPPPQQAQMCYPGFSTGGDRRPQRPTDFAENLDSSTSKRARLSSVSAQQVSARVAQQAQHSAQHSSQHAAATGNHPSSWSIPFPCHDRSCIEIQHRQMALMHHHHQQQQQQQQQHQYMLRNHQQQQWQQQLLRNNAAGACPLPLPAPPPPVSGSNPPPAAAAGSARLHAPHAAHSTGFFHHQMHPGSHQYHPPHNWHPAYFCPPSAVQLQRQQHHQQQQWLQQQQQYKQQQEHARQHQLSMQNNNCLQACSMCAEGKCNKQPVTTSMFHQQPRNVVANSNAVTHVHYRSV